MGVVFPFVKNEEKTGVKRKRFYFLDVRKEWTTAVEAASKKS
jgi:hypothetical protein